MGILESSEWKAEWVSFSKPLTYAADKDDPASQLTIEDQSWIGLPEEETEQHQGAAIFRRTIRLPEDTPIEWAYIRMAANEHVRLFVNGTQSCMSADIREPARRAYDVELTEELRPGKNVLAVEFLSRKQPTAGLVAEVVILLAGGQRITVGTDSEWKSSTGVPDWFKHELDDSAWPAASVLGKVGKLPWGIPRAGAVVGWSQKSSSPIFRKNFRVEKPVRAATAYVCGLGYHELRLNGKKVGDHVLDPAPTRYDRRVIYVAHDVTDSIHQGDNAVGVMLGNGWYNMHTRATWDFDKAPWRRPPAMLLHLRIEYEDGTTETVVSDKSWKASTGPIILDSIRAGELYDARKNPAGWDTVGYDDSHWQAPQVVEPPTVNIRCQLMPPMRVTQTIKPISVTEPRPGVFIFDLGQHMAGWVRLQAQGSAGKQVTLRYSERLDAEGMIQRSEISMYVFEGPFQTDSYVFKGEGVEQWEPRFAYHGFRYVEVTGFPGRPTLDNITGCVVHTDFPTAGRFRCSNELLNAIQEMTLWSYRGNYHGYPTDCPTREKNGWTGDAHLAAEQAMYNFHNAAAYRKWIQDIGDEQMTTGEIPAIVPTGGWGYAWGNGPAWDCAFTLIPWYLHLYRGDSRPLELHFDQMKRYVDYLTSHSKNHIVDIGLGDWVPAKTVTPVAITSTGYYYVDALIVSRTARILGKTEDAEKYASLAENIRKAFNREFHQGDGIFLNGSQTAQSCAIYQGLVEPAGKQATLEQLVAKVHEADDHLDVGILGAKYLFHSLSENGQHELAYRIATQTSPPSYGHWHTRGATTLWEDWSGIASLNHIMFGDISTWFYQKLAGINPDPQVPGFKHIVIRPMPAADLTWVEARTESMYGTIVSSWRKEADGAFKLYVVVPANTSATIHVPATETSRITESGKPADHTTGVKGIQRDGSRVTFQVGSGKYEFKVLP
jgi:alpha-L-rhamnosidase